MDQTSQIVMINDVPNKIDLGNQEKDIELSISKFSYKEKELIAK